MDWESPKSPHVLEKESEEGTTNSPSWTHKPKNQDLENQTILLCVTVLFTKLRILETRKMMHCTLV